MSRESQLKWCSLHSQVIFDNKLSEIAEFDKK